MLVKSFEKKEKTLHKILLNSVKEFCTTDNKIFSHLNLIVVFKIKVLVKFEKIFEEKIYL